MSSLTTYCFITFPYDITERVEYSLKDFWKLLSQTVICKGLKQRKNTFIHLQYDTFHLRRPFCVIDIHILRTRSRQQTDLMLFVWLIQSEPCWLGQSPIHSFICSVFNQPYDFHKPIKIMLMFPVSSKNKHFHPSLLYISIINWPPTKTYV